MDNRLKLTLVDDGNKETPKDCPMSKVREKHRENCNLRIVELSVNARCVDPG